MKSFLMLVLLTQFSIANELIPAQIKAELAAQELTGEIKAEMTIKIFELPPVEVCAWPDDKLIFGDYHSSLRNILSNSIRLSKVSQ